jgi:C1A family cysteine protease
MKVSVVVAVLSLCLVGVFAQTDPFNEKLKIEFAKFCARYGKSYATFHEERERFENFKDNFKRALRWNEEDGKPLGEENWGVTKFSDMTPEEFRNTMLLPNKPKPMYKPSMKLDDDIVLPTSFDWRPLGAVTPIYNQGQCGSCWAFSATEEIESQWFLANHTLTQLSMQQIISCDTVDEGCNGGDTPTAYQYVIKAGGLESYADYPYASGGGATGRCKFNKQDIVASISGWEYITQSPQCNETAMKVGVVNNGPLSICVDAETWQTYSGGIITNRCAQDLDHCVMIVGYNVTQAGVSYWLVRNSWGTDWGEDGYIYVEVGKNLCGIADEVTIAKV